MVAIPLIWPGQHRTGLVERFLAWLREDVAADSKPVRLSYAAPRRAAFMEDAAMSREMHRL